MFASFLCPNITNSGGFWHYHFLKQIFFSTKIGVGKRERVVEKSDKKLHKKDGVQPKK